MTFDGKSCTVFIDVLQSSSCSDGTLPCSSQWRSHASIQNRIRNKKLQKSLHSWLRLACLFLFTIQWGAGFVRFWYPGGCRISLPIASSLIFAKTSFSHRQQFLL